MPFKSGETEFMTIIAFINHTITTTDDDNKVNIFNNNSTYFHQLLSKYFSLLK